MFHEMGGINPVGFHWHSTTTSTNTTMLLKTIQIALIRLVFRNGRCQRGLGLWDQQFATRSHWHLRFHSKYGLKKSSSSSLVNSTAQAENEVTLLVLVPNKSSSSLSPQLSCSCVAAMDLVTVVTIAKVEGIGRVVDYGMEGVGII